MDGTPLRTSSSRRPTSETLKSLRMQNGNPSVFGSIKFAGVKRAPSKWCAVSSNSEPKDVYKMVQEAWKLSPPPVLIAVTGAAESLQLSKRDEKIFRRGLRNAALQTNAWIVTGGSAAGVMQLVGSLVHESGRQGTTKQIVCLGIAPWGVVQDHEEMLASGRGQVFSAKELAQGEQKRADRTRLDPNHSHFIFVDDGSEGQFGREIDFRSKLENLICKNEDANAEDAKLPTPMVLVAVGGGPGTLSTIISTLEKERPCVVMADSGGVATALWKYWKDGTLPEMNKDIKYLKDEAEVKKVAESLAKIKAVGMKEKGANKVRQLRFFHSTNDVDGENNELDRLILESILSDCDTTFEAIQHAVKWGGSDIIDHQLQRSKTVDVKQLTQCFEAALVLAANGDENSLHVVETLIEYADCHSILATDGIGLPLEHSHRTAIDDL